MSYSPIKWNNKFQRGYRLLRSLCKHQWKCSYEIIMEVLPSKIDYKEDYEVILKDVNEEIYNLAYGFLSRTYLAAEINNKRTNSQVKLVTQILEMKVAEQ